MNRLCLGFKDRRLRSLYHSHHLPQPRWLCQALGPPARSGPDLCCSSAPRHNKSLCPAAAAFSSNWLEMRPSEPTGTTHWETQWSGFFLRHLLKSWWGKVGGCALLSLTYWHLQQCCTSYHPECHAYCHGPFTLTVPVLCFVSLSHKLWQACYCPTWTKCPMSKYEDWFKTLNKDFCGWIKVKKTVCHVSWHPKQSRFDFPQSHNPKKCKSAKLHCSSTKPKLTNQPKQNIFINITATGYVPHSYGHILMHYFFFQFDVRILSVQF